ncbi:MAG: helix-turn-helix transcriptional regulator [Candidatus Solibacter usitatus]|nr:helix-turn-helix transcriptional regulator [Candidatus Solibacter usitatus]
MKNDPQRRLPLSPATLHILLALANEDLHGYGIMQAVARQSDGRYKVGPGTLYDSLERLTTRGIVTEVDSRGPEVDSRRRYYRLTPFGRKVLAAEIDRLEAVIARARIELQPTNARR